jgi:hypothetical protein
LHQRFDSTAVTRLKKKRGNVSLKKYVSLSSAMALVASFAIAIIAAPSASAADYRYWTFWTAGPVIQCSVAEGATEQTCEELPAATEWQFAQVGAQDIQLRDQSITGWRFAISTPDGSEPPVEAPDFAALCPDLAEPAEGELRAAVVIDFGSPDIAPPGDTPPSPNQVGCVTLEAGQNAADALILASGEVREDQGLVCGIDGYPSEECGAEVDAAAISAAAEEVDAAASSTPADEVDTAASDAAAESSGSSPGWLWPLVGVVVVGALIAIVISARRGRASK